ncbi:MAG: beta-lactamase family protein [Caulobacterales bacterium]|nr:beta-lactamase family protein [Caulobacterales bacterium]
MAADLDRRVTAALDTLEVVQGIGVAVYTPDGVYAQGYGVADVETRERVTPDTSFYIASSTKPLTALALTLLHHRGEIDLDAPLARIAPDAPFPSAVRPGDVTLRNLLSQSSGLRNQPIEFRSAFTGTHTPEILWRLLAHSKPNKSSALGDFAYSNYNYNIATILTDRELGVSWKDVLAAEVFDPLGMTRTSAYMSYAIEREWAVAHPHQTAEAEGPRRVDPRKVKRDATMQSAGGVIMSPSDALRWLEVMVEDGRLAGRQVFPAEIVTQTWTPHVAVDRSFGAYRRDHYGLGWYIGRYRDDVLIHHFGGFFGSRAHVSFMPEREIGVAVFINDSAVGAPLADAIANYVYDTLADRTDAAETFRREIADAVERRDSFPERLAAGLASRAKRQSQLSLALSAYAGVYESEFGEQFIMSEDANGLRATLGELTSETTWYTRPESLRVELLPGHGQAIDFTVRSGKATELRYAGETFARK